jgi:hypothetical protein
MLAGCLDQTSTSYLNHADVLGDVEDKANLGAELFHLVLAKNHLVAIVEMLSSIIIHPPHQIHHITSNL